MTPNTMPGAMRPAMRSQCLEQCARNAWSNALAMLGAMHSQCLEQCTDGRTDGRTHAASTSRTEIAPSSTRRAHTPTTPKPTTNCGISTAIHRPNPTTHPHPCGQSTTPRQTMDPVTSALTPTGSTRAWRRLRTHFEELITLTGGLPCRRCHHLIRPGQPFDLGHTTDRALGGDDTDLWPEHPTRIPGICEGNRNAGARLGNQLRAQRRALATSQPNPSRVW